MCWETETHQNGQGPDHLCPLLQIYSRGSVRQRVSYLPAFRRLHFSSDTLKGGSLAYPYRYHRIPILAPSI